MVKYLSILLFIFLFLNCKNENASLAAENLPNYARQASAELEEIIPGAAMLAKYYPKIKGKSLGLVVNQTSMINNVHLVDSLLELEAKISTIFAPEHGFRGEADAGEHINSEKDTKTGIDIVSIYGSNKKPTADQLKNIDIMIFDIQDVGARFYTYISTLHYVMEACAEQKIPLIILDRPNPNGFYVDGPVLDKDYTSFVGMHEIPVVHGMTIGEYAQMINGEGWLSNGIQCPLEVIACANYTHKMTYDLPVKPSPNLPNLRSILLYPSICYFEGTALSIGRGTNTQFQVIGHPDLKGYDFSFTPTPQPGAKNPKLLNETCFGIDLTTYSVDYLKGNAKLDLKWLLEVYDAFPEKENFFLKNLFFDKLAGSDQLRKQMIAGLTEEEIRASWEPALDKFKETRAKYLLYP